MAATRQHSKVWAFGSALMAAGMSMLMGASLAQAQGYPNRPIKLVYPFPAGGASDAVYRPIVEHMSRTLGQPVLLDSRPGGGSMVASLYIKNLAGDGYTFYALSNSVTVKSLVPNAQIDIRKDFLPIAPSNVGPLLVVVNPDLIKARTIPELIAEVKAKPGELNYASYGIGTGPHMFMEILLNAAKAKMVHVPYQGTAQAALDTAGGRVQVTATILATGRAYLTEFGGSGKLRLIGESLADRSSLLPNTPGMKEAGYPDIDYVMWGGYVAPLGTPKDAINSLNRALNAALKDAAVVDLYKRFGLEAVGGTPEDLTRIINNEYNAYEKLIRETGLKLE